MAVIHGIIKKGEEMNISQKLIKKLMQQKDEQFSNLMKYCLHGKDEQLNDIENFLGILNEASQVLENKALVNFSNKLHSSLALYGDGAKKNQDLLMKILNPYISIYLEIERLDRVLFCDDTTGEGCCQENEHNRTGHLGTILVVDDDVLILQSLKKLFTTRGYEVILSPNPFEIIKKTKDNKIDLVILDLMLPEIDGFEVIELIRRTEPELPIIMLSGDTNIVSKTSALMMGADDYITKPFEAEELIARVERTLTRAFCFKATSIEDGLTGAYTKSYFWEKMKEATNIYRRDERAFSIAFVDMDYFKDINDTYGHLTGDEVLKCFTCTLRSSLRLSDHVFRFGGDEFVIYFPETNEKAAYDALERFRNSINYKECIKNNTGIVFEGSFSAGITEIKGINDGIENIIERADIALYEAKTQGKNKTCIYGAAINSEEN